MVPAKGQRVHYAQKKAEIDFIVDEGDGPPKHTHRVLAQQRAPPLQVVPSHIYILYRKGCSREVFGPRSGLVVANVHAARIATRATPHSAADPQSLFVPTFLLPSPLLALRRHSPHRFLHLCGMIRVGCHLWRYSVALGGVLVFFWCTLFTADHMQFLLFSRGEVQLGELYYSSRKRKNIQRGVLLRTLCTPLRDLYVRLLLDV